MFVPLIQTGTAALMYHCTVTLAIAQTILALGLILSGFTTQIWQLTLTQGLMCGLGIGLVSSTHSIQPLLTLTPLIFI
jgi:hypothetical protein